jgi:hybrid cluster-associated redox disulfide protein
MAQKKTSEKKTKTKAKPAKEAKKEAKKEQAKQIITKTMLIGEIASKYPETVEVMFKHGMHCIGCGMTAYETLEQGCMGHGMSEEDVDKMVEEMNKIAAKKAK